MKKTLFFILSVLAILLVVDVTLGAGSDCYMNRVTLPGDYRSIDYVVRECDDDIVILGSSVALNSLVPSIIEDSLAMSCFNGGANAQQLPYYLTMLDCLFSRYTPRLVILGLTPDECSTEGVGERYNILAPYYHRGYSVIDSCMEQDDPVKRILLSSSMIRYNTIWWRILLYHFVTADNPGEKGYVAKDVPPALPTLLNEQVDTITGERMVQLERFIDMCRRHNTKLIVYFPPQYRRFSTTSNSSNVAVAKICERVGVKCVDDSQDTAFLAHPEWFYDDKHLNLNGAPVYTSRFIKHIDDVVNAQ